jgi:threonine dehydrogenase-like Zn-dependent dehydrogenase
VPGGQAEYLRVPQAQFGPIEVPAGFPDERFRYVSDMVPTAWQAVAYAEVPKDATPAVIGQSPIGAMCTRIARHLGVERIIGADLVEDRLARARRGGFEALDTAMPRTSPRRSSR